MRYSLFLLPALLINATFADEPSWKPVLIAKPEAHKTLRNPDCSHCVDEAKRRANELRYDDRVLSWIRGYSDGGAIPYRFFLNPYRVISDSYGVFVYDPDAGFARGFAPSFDFSFYGWRNGVMVMKHKDGTLYSCLTGIAFDGPKKGTRLPPVPTLVSDWGFWLERYPRAVAYQMFDKYQPVELLRSVHEDSRKSRGPTDKRMPENAEVVGVFDGKQARAYPTETLAKVGLIQETVNGQARVVLWHGPTKAAAAFGLLASPPGKDSKEKPHSLTIRLDRTVPAAPFIDKETGSRWDIAGRAVDGKLKGWTLTWLEGTQVKWFAWAAEYPETSIYGKDSAAKVPSKTASSESDYKPLIGKNLAVAQPLGNLDSNSRRFAILKAADPLRQRVTLLMDGETAAKEWALRPGAELWHAGWWGRLDQFTVGDRVWVWFDTDRAKQPVAVALLADEFSEQDMYAPAKVKAVNASGQKHTTVTLEMKGSKPSVRTVKLAKTEVCRGDAKAPHDTLKVAETVYVQTTGDDARLILDPAAFEKRRAAQKAVLCKRWAEEGLPGTLIFSHAEGRAVELMLDHEAMRWGRSLLVGDKIVLQTRMAVAAVVRQVRPWRERTQILLEVDGSDESAFNVGQRVYLRLVGKPPPANDDQFPAGLGASRSKSERIEWFAASVYCPCMMHDGCAGHFFTVAACDAGLNNPCGMAKRIRKGVEQMIDKGLTDGQIFQHLLKEHGPKLLRPHMLP